MQTSHYGVQDGSVYTDGIEVWVLCDAAYFYFRFLYFGSYHVDVLATVTFLVRRHHHTIPSALTPIPNRHPRPIFVAFIIHWNFTTIGTNGDAIIIMSSVSLSIAFC
jgi:hypothetical protein